MSSYGFVYILTNECMPGVFKVGCTERSPHARCDELSKPTGVPVPFNVLCYAEVPDFQAVERSLHKWLAEQRVSPDREFFWDAGLTYAMRLLAHWEGTLAFTWIDGHECGYHALTRAYGDGVDHPMKAPSPWAPKEPEKAEPPPPALKLVDNQEASA